MALPTCSLRLLVPAVVPDHCGTTGLTDALEVAGPRGGHESRTPDLTGGDLVPDVGNDPVKAHPTPPSVCPLR